MAKMMTVVLNTGLNQAHRLFALKVILSICTMMHISILPFLKKFNCLYGQQLSLEGKTILSPVAC